MRLLKNSKITIWRKFKPRWKKWPMKSMKKIRLLNNCRVNYRVDMEKMMTKKGRIMVKKKKNFLVFSNKRAKRSKN
jgi:hypothetical protein